MSRVRPVQDLVRDARYALRVLRRHRTFSAVAVLTLALGIGATTAVFSVVNGVLLQPLAYPRPDRIVSLGTRSIETGRETPRLTGSDFLDVSAQREAFASVSPFWGGAIGVQVRGAGEFASVYFVAPSFFEVFGVPPTAGRLPGAQDGERAAVVGDGFAARVFGGARLAIGQAVSVEDQQYEIVGVMPRGFDPPRATDVWLAMPSPLPRIAMNRTAFNLQAVARLRDGVSLERAQAAATALGSRLAVAFPESNRARTFSVTPLRDRIVSRARLTLAVLLGAVSLVLLIACANVANLLLARAAPRGREIGLRAALGASRSRIGRQLVAESLVLSLAGGGLGLALACAGTPALTRLAPADVPRLAEVAVDWRVLLFALACSLAASLLFGLVPAWHASRVNLNDALKQSSARGLVGAHSNRLRGALVVAEIALSFVLAAGAAVLLRSFIALTETDLGYRPESVLVATAHVPARTRADYVAVARALARLSPELAPVPGVRAVGVAMGLPSGPYGSNGGFTIEGRPETAAGRGMPDAGFRLTSPGYFAALGVALLGGRDFADADTYDAPYVAIVSRTLVNRDFAGENPLGRRIRCGLDAPDTWMTIVGVVGDVRQNSPASPPSPEIYMPLQQHPYHANEVHVVIRTAVEPETIVPAVREQMRRLDPATALSFTTLERMVSATIATQRFLAWIVGLFAGLALLLALAGVYGVMAYVASQRLSEFGLRLALGAGPRSLFRLVVVRAAWLAVIGIGVGLILSAAMTRLLAAWLPATRALDATSYAWATALVAVVVAGAASLPAWQASRADPLTALRDE